MMGLSSPPPQTGAGDTRECRTRSHCPGSPGDPWAQYIRSGPEGARGVLNFGGWSFEVTLSRMYLANYVGLMKIVFLKNAGSLMSLVEFR